MAAGPETITFSIDRLRVGTTLAGPVYEDDAGTILLLSAGLCVTADQIEQLKNRGVEQIRVEKRFAASIMGGPRVGLKLAERVRRAKSEPDKVAPPIQRAAPMENVSRSLSQSMAKVRQAQSERLTQVYSLLDCQGTVSKEVFDDIARECIEQLSVDLDLLIKGSLEPQMSEAASDHCVRVSQLAVSVGAVAGHTREELRWLGMGCLVSRLATTPTARKLSEEARKLSPVELMEIKRTPGRVFEMLCRIDFPWVARTVAYQIHERWNGTGYPRGKSGGQIHPLARIAAVCDVYVSLTSPRAHRPPFSLFDAVKQILADTRIGLFAPNTVRDFLRTISLYPIGAFVRLNTGQIGRVVRTTPDAYDRPSIELIGETPPRLLSLAESPELRVVEVIEAEQAAEETFVPQENQLKASEIKILLGVAESDESASEGL